MHVLRIICLWAALAPGALAQTVQMEALNPATARAIQGVVVSAEKTFLRMPQVRLTTALSDVCGGDSHASDWVQYCTDLNTIFVAADLEARLGAQASAYAVAHAYGHAVQVVHGQATLALSAIRAQPAREAELRGMVTRQVACLAGLIYARAIGDDPVSMTLWFSEEPFVDSHWGRNPMSGGPKVSIGLTARDEWFQRGQGALDVAACAVEEMEAGPLLRAVR